MTVKGIMVEPLGSLLCLCLIRCFPVEQKHAITKQPRLLMLLLGYRDIFSGHIKTYCSLVEDSLWNELRDERHLFPAPHKCLSAVRILD